jgi:hypothetical protein
MPVRLNVDRIVIQNVPDSWEGGVDTFRRVLESAIDAELRNNSMSRSLQEHEVLRVDLPPIMVIDIYDMQDTAREIARRILQAVRQQPE